MEGDYYSFLNGVLYEFEYGRTYELYLSDSLFYFPSLIPSEEGCLPFVCNYQLESGVLVLDSVGESYEITTTDSLLILSTEEYALAFNFQEEVRSIESNFSEIYFEIYFDGEHLLDSMTVDMKGVDLRWDETFLGDRRYLSYLSWVVNSIPPENFNKIYGLNVADDYQINVSFKSNEGKFFEVISYGKSFDQPYEILLLRDCILRLNRCLN